MPLRTHRARPGLAPARAQDFHDDRGETRADTANADDRRAWRMRGVPESPGARRVCFRKQRVIREALRYAHRDGVWQRIATHTLQNLRENGCGLFPFRHPSSVLRQPSFFLRYPITVLRQPIPNVRGCQRRVSHFRRQWIESVTAGRDVVGDVGLEFRDVDE